MLLILTGASKMNRRIKDYLLLVLIILAVAISISSCSNDEEENTPDKNYLWLGYVSGVSYSPEGFGALNLDIITPPPGTRLAFLSDKPLKQSALGQKAASTSSSIYANKTALSSSETDPFAVFKEMIGYASSFVSTTMQGFLKGILYELFKIEIHLLVPLKEDAELNENISVKLEKQDSSGNTTYEDVGYKVIGNAGSKTLTILLDVYKLLKRKPGRIIIKMDKSLWDMGSRVDDYDGIGLIFKFTGFQLIGTPKTTLTLLSSPFSGLSSNDKGYISPYWSYNFFFNRAMWLTSVLVDDHNNKVRKYGGTDTKIYPGSTRFWGGEVVNQMSGVSYVGGLGGYYSSLFPIVDVPFLKGSEESNMYLIGGVDAINLSNKEFPITQGKEGRLLNGCVTLRCKESATKQFSFRRSSAIII